MKKILLTLLVSLPIISFAQGIPFKVTSNLELVWSKEYDGELNITSSQINLNNTEKGVAIYLRDIHSAEMIVKKGDGKTRVIVRNIRAMTALDSQPALVNGLVVNKDTKALDPKFLSRDARTLANIIERAIQGEIEISKM